jgi:hypothetical protein
MKCCHCGTNKAVIKDYRTMDGITGSIPSCRPCMHLSDETVHELSLCRTNAQRIRELRRIYGNDDEFLTREFPNLDWE